MSRKAICKVIGPQIFSYTLPFWVKIMSRDGYIHILRCLNFHDNEEIANHPLVKIKSVIGHVQSKFSAVLTPWKNLCIDESLFLWKGRLQFKRNRFRIKLDMIVDYETGFVLGFVVYTGADTDYQKLYLGVTGDIEAHFLQPYFYKVVYILDL